MPWLSVTLLLALAHLSLASGPYSPVRVMPNSADKQDEVYSAGKAIFMGAVKVGSGATCSGCHTGPASLTRAKLSRIKAELPSHIETCARAADRGKGALQSNQLNALSHYLSKRFRL